MIRNRLSKTLKGRKSGTGTVEPGVKRGMRVQKRVMPSMIRMGGVSGLVRLWIFSNLRPWGDR